MDNETKVQQRKFEFALTVIVVILSMASAGLLFFGPLEIVSYADYGYFVIIPSVVVVFIIGIISLKRFPHLAKKLFVGMAAGTIATIVLEAIRIPGYMFLKWIPMDSMISVPGLLLTGTISSLSEVKQVIMQSGVPVNLYHAPVDIFLVGGLWHFWNGATFGIIYSLIIGKGKLWYGMIWAFIIEIGMMLTPYLIMMKGPFGIQHLDGYNLFAITLVAHLVFGSILGIIVQRWNKKVKSIKDLMQ